MLRLQAVHDCIVFHFSLDCCVELSLVDDNNVKIALISP